MTDELDIEALERLRAEATPGPWHFVEENAGLMSDHGYGLLYGTPDAWGWEKNLYISVGCSHRVERDLGKGAAEANASLIVAAVNALPSLTAEIRSLRRERDALLAERDTLRDALLEARAHIDGEIDVVDGDYGEPRPNAAMRLAQNIDEALEPRK